MTHPRGQGPADTAAHQRGSAIQSAEKRPKMGYMDDGMPSDSDDGRPPEHEFSSISNTKKPDRISGKASVGGSI